MEADARSNDRTLSPATKNPMALTNLLNPVDTSSPVSTSSSVSYHDEASTGTVGPLDGSLDSLSISICFQTDHGSIGPRGGQRRPSGLINPARHMPRQNLSLHSPIRYRHTRCHQENHSTNHYRQARRSRPLLERKRAPNANRAYTPEQADWIRYMKEDCNLSWKNHPERFAMQFPDVRDSNQGFSSRYYRDNKVPRPDENWNLIFDADHTLVLMDAPVRNRSTPEGRVLDIPYTLVEKHPERALKYSWVSDNHKAEARRVMSGLTSRGKKTKWRALIREAESKGLI